jgi:hypothetical protein
MRNIVPGVSETAFWAMGDKKLYPEPEEVNKWELIGPIPLNYPTVTFGECKKLWDSAKGQILADWIYKFPGMRPSFWWLFDAPRITPESVFALGRGEGWVERRREDYCEPRKRLAGIGTPCYEVLNYVPHFYCGIPDSWLTQCEVKTYSELGRERNAEPFTGAAIGPNDPPKFESQAAYLERHGLLAPEEKRRLKLKDFEPELIGVEEDEEDEAMEALNV